MRLLLGSVVLLGLLVCVPAGAGARCGDRPGDRTALDSAAAAIVAECCCTLPALAPRRVSGPSCTRRVAVLLIADDALPRRCAPLAMHTARRVCLAQEEKPSCVPTTTTTLPVAPCRTTSDCDDGNSCSADTCAGGRCVHVCRCYGPGGSQTCCPGPSVLCSRLHYFTTCPYPVCPMVPKPIPGLPACTTQHLGDPCTRPGNECDVGSGCGVRLRCDDHAPPTGSCPTPP